MGEAIEPGAVPAVPWTAIAGLEDVKAQLQQLLVQPFAEPATVRGRLPLLSPPPAACLCCRRHRCHRLPLAACLCCRRHRCHRLPPAACLRCRRYCPPSYRCHHRRRSHSAPLSQRFPERCFCPQTLPNFSPRRCQTFPSRWRWRLPGGSVGGFLCPGRARCGAAARRFEQSACRRRPACCSMARRGRARHGWRRRLRRRCEHDCSAARGCATV